MDSGVMVSRPIPCPWVGCQYINAIQRIWWKKDHQTMYQQCIHGMYWSILEFCESQSSSIASVAVQVYPVDLILATGREDQRLWNEQPVPGFSQQSFRDPWLAAVYFEKKEQPCKFDCNDHDEHAWKGLYGFISTDKLHIILSNFEALRIEPWSVIRSIAQVTRMVTLCPWWYEHFRCELQPVETKNMK